MAGLLTRCRQGLSARRGSMAAIEETPKPGDPRLRAIGRRRVIGGRFNAMNGAARSGALARLRRRAHRRAYRRRCTDHGPACARARAGACGRQEAARWRSSRAAKRLSRLWAREGRPQSGDGVVGRRCPCGRPGATSPWPAWAPMASMAPPTPPARMPTARPSRAPRSSRSMPAPISPTTTPTRSSSASTTSSSPARRRRTSAIFKSVLFVQFQILAFVPEASNWRGPDSNSNPEPEPELTNSNLEPLYSDQFNAITENKSSNYCARKSRIPQRPRAIQDPQNPARRARDVPAPAQSARHRPASSSQTKGGRVGLPDKMDLVVGRLQTHAAGYGFVVPDKTGEAARRRLHLGRQHQRSDARRSCARPHRAPDEREPARRTHHPHPRARQLDDRRPLRARPTPAWVSCSRSIAAS